MLDFTAKVDLAKQVRREFVSVAQKNNSKLMIHLVEDELGIKLDTHFGDSSEDSDDNDSIFTDEDDDISVQDSDSEREDTITGSMGSKKKGFKRKPSGMKKLKKAVNMVLQSKSSLRANSP